MSFRYPRNTVNLGPLAAEIGSGVWGTPTNFNGFRVLAALLHYCVEQRAPPIFGRATITLGIGPHSSYFMLTRARGAKPGIRPERHFAGATFRNLKFTKQDISVVRVMKVDI